MVGSRSVTLLALLVALSGATACGVPGSATTTTTTTDMDGDRPIADTWERAAVAEAERLNPGLVDVRVDRVDIPASFERVRVRAAGGYCHIFGGKYDSRVGWQANDLGTC
jgi:ABC-type glycerol-3-phosphate transport system substrate-binding protein